MRIHLTFIFTILLSLIPINAIAETENTEKRACLLAFGYDSLEELQADLITKAQLSAVDEFFGALIVSSTAVENAVVTSDSIRISSMGYVHLKGNAQFENSSQLGQICVTASFEVTDEDREKFEPIAISGRECVNDPDLTTRQLKEFGQKRAIIKALVEHDPRLVNTEENALLQLMRNIKYTESQVLKDTDTFCATVNGKVVPAELEALLELGSIELPTGSDIYNDEFDGPELNENWSWQQEDPSRWSLDENPGKLTIQAVGGEFAFGCTNYQNLLLQPAPSGDFDITTKVIVQPTQNYQQGGLLVFQDVDNWVKFDVVWADAFNGQAIELIVEQDGKFVPDLPNRPVKSLKLPTDGTYLEVNKIGHVYEASYSIDNKTWYQLGSLSALNVMEPKIGLFAIASSTSLQNAPNCSTTTPEIPVDFDFFHVDIPKTDTNVADDNNSQTENIILTSPQDNERHDWVDGKPYMTSKTAIDGDVGFIPTGNNHIGGQFGVVGYEPNEIRFIKFEVYLTKRDAGLIFQAQFDGDWEHRWVFDGRESYQGVYGWARKGETVDLPVGKWVTIKLDLIDQLGARPGQQLTGVGFAGADGNLVYDRVSVISEAIVSQKDSRK